MALTAWAQEQQAKHEAWNEIGRLKAENKKLEAERDAALTRIEQLRELLLWCLKSGRNGYTWEDQDICSVQESIDKTPAQCLAEHDAKVAAKAIKDAIKSLSTFAQVPGTTLVCKKELQQYADKLHQAAKDKQ